MDYKELAERAKISPSFATQLLSGERKASLQMAFQVYDATGLQFGILNGLLPETIEQLRPKTAQDEAA
jgi:transcriptional regulator with XRE-family HTH domain